MAIRSLLKLPLEGYASEAEMQKDLDAMVALAKKQPGFISVEIWRSHNDKEPVTFLVESVWETREDMAAMEHRDELEEVLSNYPPEPVHLRVVDWVRPA